jgi:hypothetical protein
MRSRKRREKEVSKAVIEDRDELYAFLAAQPLCKWLAKKQRELVSGTHHDRGGAGIHHPPASPKNDNAELAAALSSMA